MTSFKHDHLSIKGTLYLPASCSPCDCLLLLMMQLIWYFPFLLLGKVYYYRGWKDIEANVNSAISTSFHPLVPTYSAANTECISFNPLTSHFSIISPCSDSSSVIQLCCPALLFTLNIPLLSFYLNLHLFACVEFSLHPHSVCSPNYSLLSAFILAFLCYLQFPRCICYSGLLFFCRGIAL